MPLSSTSTSPSFRVALGFRGALVCPFTGILGDSSVSGRALEASYVEGDFPAIVSQEVWDKAQKIRESRMKPSLVSTTKTAHSKRDSKDTWVNKLRCSCGSSFRKDKWHTKLDGKISYGNQCYNQINNGNKKKREALGLDTEGYCDIRMVTDWKLDFMAKELLENLWQDRKEAVLIAIDLIKRYYKDERLSENQHDVVSIRVKIDKAQTRLTNLIAMRQTASCQRKNTRPCGSPLMMKFNSCRKS